MRCQDFAYNDASVVDVIRDIETATSYRFLYRDALISGVKVSFASQSADLLRSLSGALEGEHLRLQVDHERNMVFVLPASALPREHTALRGTVSDALTLERLPHATITWHEATGVRGVVSDEGGRFLLEIPPSKDRLLMVASYLGYNPDTLRLNFSNTPSDIAIKLMPRVVVGSEVVVSSPLLASNLDSTWFYLINSDLATPVGESSVTRALQILPAVGLTTAVSSGLNVRGSRTDGFQVLLDGVPIYNQAHLFGMFDAFTPDVLQAVDFYYGIAPARFQAPPGGTVSFLTRTGSKRQFHTRVGLTSSSASATAEGPVSSGRASWIVSARRSYLDSIDWFNNADLVAIGLGVGRETSSTRRTPLDDRTLTSLPPDAMFFDTHAKFEHESPSGATFQISAYVGGDRTSQDGRRIIALDVQRQDPRIVSTVTTKNDWGNVATSIHYRSAVRRWGYTHTYAGFTRFYSDYRKDDFFYRAPQAGNTEPQLLFAPFLNDNSLTEGRLSNESFFRLSPASSASAGFSIQRIVSTYDELSALRRDFESRRRAWQLDVFAELNRNTEFLSITAGLRPHYFSSGSYLRLSPRLLIATPGDLPFSFSAGYTRNYQFAHRLYIEHPAGSDIWTLTNDDEPPGAVNHFTASFAHKQSAFTFQLEGFLKHQQNLRRHETLLRPGGLPDGALLLSPWTHDNQARSEGLEALFSRRQGPALLTATYTLSRTRIRHPSVNSGNYFYADWDRPHQLALHSQIDLTEHLRASAAWLLASGQPNSISYIRDSEPTRNPIYRRLDLTFQYARPLAGAHFTALLRFYNLLDAHNVWYRTLETVLQGRGQNLHLAFEPVDVYDLGLQPSFGLALSF